MWDDFVTRKRQGGRVFPYVVLWMLGVPATLLVIMYLLGIGR